MKKEIHGVNFETGYIDWHRYKAPKAALDRLRKVETEDMDLRTFLDTLDVEEIVSGNSTIEKLPVIWSGEKTKEGLRVACVQLKSGNFENNTMRIASILHRIKMRLGADAPDLVVFPEDLDNENAVENSWLVNTRNGYLGKVVKDTKIGIGYCAGTHDRVSEKIFYYIQPSEDGFQIKKFRKCFYDNDHTENRVFSLGAYKIAFLIGAEASEVTAIEPKSAKGLVNEIEGAKPDLIIVSGNFSGDNSAYFAQRLYRRFKTPIAFINLNNNREFKGGKSAFIFSEKAKENIVLSEDEAILMADVTNQSDPEFVNIFSRISGLPQLTHDNFATAFLSLDEAPLFKGKGLYLIRPAKEEGKLALIFYKDYYHYAWDQGPGWTPDDEENFQKHKSDSQAVDKFIKFANEKLHAKYVESKKDIVYFYQEITDMGGIHADVENLGVYFSENMLEDVLSLLKEYISEITTPNAPKEESSLGQNLTGVLLDKAILPQEYGAKACMLAKAKSIPEINDVVPAAIAVRLTDPPKGISSKDKSTLKDVVKLIEDQTKHKFGKDLLLAARSSPVQSKPGVFSTALYVGFTQDTLDYYASRGQSEFGFETYVYFMQSYIKTVIGKDEKHCNELFQPKEASEKWEIFAKRLAGLLENKYHIAIPKDPYDQLSAAIIAEKEKFIITPESKSVCTGSFPFVLASTYTRNMERSAPINAKRGINGIFRK